MPADSPALHLIQHIRDEAHRFAISAAIATNGPKSKILQPWSKSRGLGRNADKRCSNILGGLQGILTHPWKNWPKCRGSARLRHKTFLILCMTRHNTANGLINTKTLLCLLYPISLLLSAWRLFPVFLIVFILSDGPSRFFAAFVFWFAGCLMH